MEQPFIVTREIAQKVLSVVDQGLSSGLGRPIPGEMCVEAAVNYALGRPHGDDPGCVSAAYRSCKIALNDSSWSSPQARAKGMRNLAIAQLGSKGVVDDLEFAKLVSEMVIRKIVPVAIYVVASLIPSHSEQLNKVAIVCEQEGTAAAARAAWDAAWAAAGHAGTAEAAAWAAGAARAAEAAAGHAGAARAAEAATRAARAAAGATAWAAGAAAGDGTLILFSDELVKIMIKQQSPGTKYLFLTDLTESSLS